ncbi:TetR/AcrR family transcriptional regulator [Curtobacterium flaccumfaciens]|uniref:TetR/AcrR family transcriptional regulator n=1 Tax=Curtobacterium flaccumfaciens TaxID=2035 RepID=UPI001BDEAF50|nr:TetR/AcrR family transcriptional regulator [Curtobacterium flaccumfaciens]MBT1608009.1 TetR family transcriptional regulator [Curtobacterium flaccumfaciens pv. betae]MBT1658518.1 TetR family transcriptional regulator [Curtobacterium flaccumfaciens pv. betae]MCS0472867.1 TetR/AcrR family transcriptional regulator [Curtobacterium flaccumfaciens pv. betae]MCS0476234.1 TetR/AcrR family transcriptional regulator [Curtobacterium flaccumfaciens pv. betae]MCS0479717.1 TetR/AcrR family transcription
MPRKVYMRNHPGDRAHINKENVAVVALDLFREYGYEHVTIEDIADVADISKHNLERMFPTKASIIYGDLDACAERLLFSFTDAHRDTPLKAALETAYRAIGDLSDEALARMRLRVQILATQPAVAGESGFYLQSLIPPTVWFLSTRDGGSPDNFRTFVIAHLLASAATAALAWWASHTDEDPRHALTEAVTLALKCV